MGLFFGIQDLRKRNTLCVSDLDSLTRNSAPLCEGIPGLVVEEGGGEGGGGEDVHPLPEVLGQDGRESLAPGGPLRGPDT